MVEVKQFKLEAIGFDVDDTLIPTTIYTGRARKQAIENLVDAMQVDGLKINERRVNKIFKKVLTEFGPDYKHHFEELMRRLRIPEEMQSRYAAAAVEGYRQLRPSLKPFPRVTSTLQTLRHNGYKLYGISKGKGIHQWDKIRTSGLLFLLNGAFITGDYNFEDKNEKFYKLVLDRLSIEGKYFLMVGDRVEKDILPARACGMHTARVLTGKYRNGNGKADDDSMYRIKKVEDVPKIVAQIEQVENDRLKAEIAKLI